MKNPTLFRNSVVVSLAAAAGAFFSHQFSARADGVPEVEPLLYAGTLEDDGVLVDGAVPIGFALFDDADPAAPENRLCDVPSANRTVTRGRFRIDTSACRAALSDNAEVFVELTVRGAPLPRTKVGAVPYALEAERAQTAVVAEAVAGGAVDAASIAEGAVTAAAVAEGAVSVAKLDDDVANKLVPNGAVMAFNAAACPSGWAEFTEARGRVIVGVNDGLNGLSGHGLGSVFGAELHQIQTSEMPAHRHDRGTLNIVDSGGHSHDSRGVSVAVFSPGPQGVITENGTETFRNAQFSATHAHGTSDFRGEVGSTGGSEPMSIVQPSIALIFCQKVD